MLLTSEFMGREFVRTEHNVAPGVKPGPDIRRATVIGGRGDKKASRPAVANEPFFGSAVVLQRGLRLVDRRRRRRRRTSTPHRRRRDLKPLLARACAHGSRVLTAGIFRRQAFRKIYGEVTAWIAMNSAHPPLSGLVIVLNLLAPQVLRAYT